MKIVFIGDISFTGVFKRRCIIDKNVHNFIHDADAVVINLEGVCTDVYPKSAFSKKEGAMPLVSPGVSWHTLKALLPQKSEIIINLCNNHTFDTGPEEVYKTIEKCKCEGWKWLGVGENITEASSIIKLNNNLCSVSMIGIAHQEGSLAGETSPGVFSDTNLPLIKDKILEARKTSDYVIVNYHGGEEFTFTPLPPRRKLLKNFIDLGADFVIAHHPHAVQGYEIYQNKYIFYSLGNFIFDIPVMHKMEGTDESVIIKLDLGSDKISWQSLCTKMDYDTSYVFSEKNNSKFSEINGLNYKGKWSSDSKRLLAHRIKTLAYGTFNKTGKHIYLSKLPIKVQRLIRCIAAPLYLFTCDVKDYRYKYLWLGTVLSLFSYDKSTRK